MTKKIYAIMMKKMVKVKKKTRNFCKTLRGFSNPAQGFFPTFQYGGKNPAGFYQKKKYQKFIKK